MVTFEPGQDDLRHMRRQRGRHVLSPRAGAPEADGQVLRTAPENPREGPDLVGAAFPSAQTDAPPAVAGGLPGVEVHRLIGRGGSARVYEVSAAAVDGPLALKVLEPGEAAAPLRRREVEVLAALSHEHLVQTHGLAQSEVGPGLLMEYLPGGSLEQLVRSSGRLTPGQAVTVLAPVASALDFLHARDVTHGDLSPGNVLFTEHGMPKLTDFGLAGLLGRPGGEGRTLGFTAPERGAAGPEASTGTAQDIYAWGALAWFTLTGRVPEPVQVRPPLPSLVPQLGAEVAELVEAALDPLPERRPGAAQLHRGIFAAGTPEPLDLTASVDDVGLSRLVTRLPGRPAADRGIRRWFPLRAGVPRGGQPRFYQASLPEASPRKQRVRGTRERKRLLRWPGFGRAARLAAIGAAFLASAVAFALVMSAWLGWPQAEQAAAGPERAVGGAHTDASQPSGPEGNRPGQPGAAAAESAPEEEPDPGHAVVELAARRDAALLDLDAEALNAIYAEEGAAAADRDILAQLERLGVRYAGLQTELSDVVVLENDGESARVAAASRMAAYEVLDRSGTVVESVAPGPSVRIFFALTRSEERQWRIAEIRQEPLP